MTIPVFDSAESKPRDGDRVQAHGYIYEWNERRKSLDSPDGRYYRDCSAPFIWSPLICDTVKKLVRNEERVTLYRDADGWQYTLVVKGAPDIDSGYFKTAYEAWLAGLEHYKNHRNEYPVV